MMKLLVAMIGEKWREMEMTPLSRNSEWALFFISFQNCFFLFNPSSLFLCTEAAFSPPSPLLLCPHQQHLVLVSLCLQGPVVPPAPSCIPSCPAWQTTCPEMHHRSCHALLQLSWEQLGTGGNSLVYG